MSFPARFIHILNGSGDPQSMNGVNRVVHALATTQTISGMNVEVWAMDPNPSQPRERNYPFRVFKPTRTRALLSHELRLALHELSQDTWVQLHSVFIPELTSVARLLCKRGISYGATPHGGYLSLYFESSKIRRSTKVLFADVWENWMLRHAAMIHVIGVTELEDLQRRAPQGNFVLIPNGYTPTPLSLKANRNGRKSRSIIYCGRHEIAQKGLDLLLKGFAAYKHAGGTLSLIMIGAGKDTATLQSLARELEVADATTWPGVLTGEALQAMLITGDAFIHTSRFDVLPTACLEAAALGIPLCVSRETNFSSYLLPRKAGWIVQPNAPNEIAEKMLEIERTPPQVLSEMGENAQRMITEELRWDRICQRLQQAILDCTAIPR